MNIWSKMITALKGGVNEIGESIVDEHALRILDQEIRDAAEDLNQTKNTLASIIAQQKVAEENASVKRTAIKEHEEYAIAALNKGDEDLALDVAEKVAQLENDKAELLKAIKVFKEQASSLRDTISIADSQLHKLKQKTETIKATEALHRAQQVVAQRHSSQNPRLRTALDSLERIKEKQRQDAAQISADIEMSKDSMESELDRKLREAGITSDTSAQQVLQRIKNKKR